MKSLPIKPKALLIDLDGTLVDSLPALKDCYTAFMQRHGKEASHNEFAFLIGPSLSEIVTYLKEKYALPHDFKELYREYQELVVEAYANKVVLFSDSLEVLHKFRAKGIELALVTSASLTLIKPFISQRHIVEIFDVVITHLEGEDSKPSPKIYNRALKHLDVLPEEAVAVEDSKNGILSAHEANLYVVQFAGRLVENGRPMPMYDHASSKVSSWLELEKLLNL